MAIYRGSGGSTSTTDQATIDQVAEDAATATTKAAEAASSATAAATSASSASSSATSASTSASSATSSASNAATSAAQAATSAATSAAYSDTASTAATNASSSETNAATSAAAALASEGLAEDHKDAAAASDANAQLMNEDAQKSAYGAVDVLQTLSDSSTLYSARHYASKTGADKTAAAASATAAAASETAAATSETAAAASETAAAGSATAAATSATAAASSATSASGSATTATTKASEAATSATNAAASETAAAASETAAASSATSASTSASTATTKASEAATSATNAATSASSASSAQTAAEAAKDAALAALDNFDDRYLGVKTSDPTLDNDGNALVTGALYFNSTDDVMKVYDGSAWRAAYADLSGALLATNNLSDLASASAARTNLGLGTAATTASTDYATAAQGALADSAVQPSDNISTLTNDSGYITGVSVSGISDTTITTPADNEVLAYDSTTSKWINQTPAEAGLQPAGSYLTGNQTITLSGDATGSGTTSIVVTVADDSHNHVISNVDGLQTALDGKQPLTTVLTNTTASYTTAEETKLAGIETGATADQSITAGSGLTGGGTGDVTLNVGAGTGVSVAADSISVNYGTTAGTACQGNDSRLSNSRTCNNSFDNPATARTNLGLGSLATLSAVGAAQITDNTVGAAELNVSGNGTTSQFLRSDGDGTFTWATPTDTNTTYSAGAGLDLTGTTFSVESDLRGDVYYIGRDTNDFYLVNTTDHSWYLDGVLDMRLTNAGTLHCDGDVVAYSTTTSSDEKLKDNIRVVDNALDKVQQLRGVEFEWKKDGTTSAGVIAQDVEKVLPCAVKTVEDLNTQEPYKTVNYDALHGLLIEAVKELTKRVEELENK